jgi:uncharacterized protein
MKQHQNTLWRQMPSGARWPLLNPTEEDVFWPDVAESLAKICRWGGSTTVTYSVAQHSCHVADLLPHPLKLKGLLHDTDECGLGFDMPSPTKMLFRSLGGAEALKQAEDMQKKAFFAAAGLTYPIPDHEAALIKKADNVIAATERRDLNRPCNFAIEGLPPPLSDPIRAWPWPRAMEEFLNRLERWLPPQKRGLAWGGIRVAKK